MAAVVHSDEAPPARVCASRRGRCGSDPQGVRAAPAQRVMLTDEQIAMRRSGLGSSEVAAVVGEHPYNNTHRVWLLKRGLIDDTTPNDAMWLGNEMEPIIAKRYAQETGVSIVRGPGTVQHPEHPWAMATTDYEWADASRIVECKWVGGRTMAHWTMDADGAPPYVMLQQAWQMFVRSAQRAAADLPPIERADTAVIFGATAEFRIYEFAHDHAVTAALFAICQRFWGWVQSGEAPPVDGSEDARRVLTELYQRNRAPLKPAPAEAEQWFWEYIRAGEAADAAEAARELAGNHLRKLIGDAEGIEGHFGKVTWKANKIGVRALKPYPRKAT